MDANSATEDSTLPPLTNLEGFRDALRQAWDDELGPNDDQIRARFARIKADAEQAWNREFGAEGQAVDDFQAVWLRLYGALQDRLAQFRTLRERLAKETGGRLDPAEYAVDLLGAAGKARDERAHTNAIATLLNPQRSPRLAAKLLAALIKSAEVPGFDDVTEQQFASATVDVEPPYRFGPTGRLVFPDLRVLIPSSTPCTLLLENKVDAGERDGQLDDYVAAARMAARPGDRLGFVFLTPDGRDPEAAAQPEEWACLSYASLVCAWRRVLRDHRDGGPEVMLLALYLASAVRVAWGVALNEHLTPRARCELIPYLEAALGEDSR